VSVRPLKEEDLEQLFALRRVAFLDRSDFSDPEVRARHLARLPHTRGYFEGERLSSACVLFPFEMYLGGQPVKMGGLASVLSAPEFRRRGHVKALLLDALARLREAGTPWCLEYPFDPRFYGRYAWQSVPGGVVVSAPSDRLFRGPAPEAEQLGPGDVHTLEPLYKRWAQEYNFTLTRESEVRPGWTQLVRRPWETQERLIYRLQGAYCVLELAYEQGRTELSVHDYAYTSPEGRARLLTFIGAFHGQAERVTLHLPADEPLLFDLQGYVTPDAPTLQARIVDVKLALEALPSTFVSTFVLRVRDDFCGWNDGTFQIEMSASGNRVTTAQASPDLTLDVRTLALLLSGGSSTHAAGRAGLLEGDMAAAGALGALSGGRRPFMPRSDYF